MTKCSLIIYAIVTGYATLYFFPEDIW